MARSNAVAAISGQLFEDGWSKLRGSTQGLHQKRQQMVRAAGGHRSAVFKAIRSGGTHTRAQLSNQLAYLTTKSSFIVDSRGVLDGKKQLSPDEIKSVVDRFAARWDQGFNPKMGHTTHMLMSFPVGTRGSDVRDIASAVSERFFATEGRNFDYLIAVHEDRAHPHAHVVLNRRSQEGEFFYLGRHHDFNYDSFREAMVEEAQKLGVRLEATRRIDRGIVTYAPRTGEVYSAKAEGRAPVERERVGGDLDRALADIATNAKVYRSLAAEATADNREDIANALFRAGEMLARGGHLEQRGEVYMANDQTFDELRSAFSERMGRVEAMVAAKPEAQRPAAEAQLHEIYRSVQHMQPLGTRSQSLIEAPSADGVYSEANINREALGQLREPETRARIETALRGTGISSEAIISRIETTANNAALEREWLSNDLQKIAETDGLNLERREDIQKAVDRLDQVHVQLGTVLERAEVLRDNGVVETDAEPVIRTDSGPIRVQSEAIVAREPEAVADQERDVLRNATIQQGVGAEIARYRAEGHDRASIGGRLLEIEESVEARVEKAEARGEQLGSWDRLVEADRREELREIEAETRAQDLAAVSPTVARVVEHERNDKLNPAFTDAASGAAYRAEIERELDEDQVQALKNGDADALKDVLDDRLERLYAAKAYLQSDATTANSDATREVLSEIADEEYEAHRVKHTHGETEKGVTHG
ncbi:relaxase/mobilization nuclease domain-containing protein [Paracoccus sp. 228]|uniref:relaxase/mobilization nuclease domain-containing protein n=1 Tax=Paracoccus sp. 228 TaxID=1192054 RepID=UPI0005EA59B3|nr:relaxase/mobilization nuclease domain-containing protein [Paracoccus sp. 228]KIX16162.1 hypothetical protein SY26_19500 [Paracoccus sp. 228]